MSTLSAASVSFQPPPASSAPVSMPASGSEGEVLPTNASPESPLCRFFNTKRGCHFGSLCRNRHVLKIGPGNVGAATSDDPPNLNGAEPSATVCRYFAAGNCMYGDACWYRHDAGVAAEMAASGSSVPLNATSTGTPAFKRTPSNERITPVPSTSKAIPILPPSSSTASSSTSRQTYFPTYKRNAQPEPEPCAICFEEMPETYGLLSDCSHAFCYECIRSWRQPASGDRNAPTALSGVIKACPTCRTPSKFITPSKMFYKQGDKRKEGVVEAYKQRLAKIPCMHLVKTPERPYCPFGRDCFYSHISPITGEKHVFTHGIEDTARRAAENARRRSMRRTLNSMGRMLHRSVDVDYGDDERQMDFADFLAVMREEFGDIWVDDAWAEEDEDEEGDEDEDEEVEEEEDWDDEDDYDHEFGESLDYDTMESFGWAIENHPNDWMMRPWEWDHRRSNYPGFRRPTLDMYDDVPSLNYGERSRSTSPSGDAERRARPRGSAPVFVPATSLSAPYTAEAEAEGTSQSPHPTSTSTSNERPPIVMNDFAPEDIPWNDDPSSRRDGDGWWCT